MAGPGTITISREVPQRPAFAVGQPGTVTTVQASPVDTIFGVTATMVAVLSDDQSAAVAAGIPAQNLNAPGTFLGADSPFNSQLGGVGEVGTQSFGGLGLSNTISSAVGTATGALSGALAPLAALPGSE